MAQKYVLVIAGPTAVGKTSLCIDLALYFQTEIISADSRQFYKEMEIGTAKPSEKELSAVPHHFVNTLSIAQEYDVRQYEQDALEVIDKLLESSPMVILTGGSGMYIKAVTEGFDEMPGSDPEIRAQLNGILEKGGIGELQERLQHADPEFFGEVDLNNPQRIIRALEVLMISGRPFSSFRTGLSKERSFKIIKIGLERERPDLYGRIDQRMDTMVAEGLFEEAAHLYPYRHHNALQTVGYKEIFDFLDGKYDKEEALRLLKRNSRRYAKRQITWFKKDPDFVWFHPEDWEGIVRYIEQEVG